MSRFRFSRWLAGSSSLLAVVLIAAGGASAQTTGWDFAALLGNIGPCQLLANPQTVSQAGFGSIEVSSPDATPTVKGGNLPVGASERGLGLSLSAVTPPVATAMRSAMGSASARSGPWNWISAT
jgi:hypothetical protein